jgi:4-amino-4-deoxy-L-arabinose transferase-like glycosyltransferase
MPERRLRYYWVLILPALLQVLLSQEFGLGVDEAHYMLYAKHLDWSYFDHPPLIAWVHLFFNSAFGWNEFSARLPAIALGYLASLEVYHYLRGKNFCEEAALAGALSLSASFLLFALQLFLLPDTFLIVGIFVLIKAVEGVVARGRAGDWLRLGFVLGLLGLAKYTSVLFVIPVAWYLMEKRGARIFKDRGLYFAVAIALVMIGPVLYWNGTHDWISFKYQIAHVNGGGLHPRAFWESLAGQIGAYNPLLFALAAYGFWKSWKLRKSGFALEFYLMLTIFVFFVKSSFSEPILPHWTAPFFALAIPLGAAVHVKKFYWAAAFGWLLIFAVHTEFAFHWIPAATPAYRDICGYRELADRAVDRSDDGMMIAVTNWTYASRMMFYLEDRRDVVVLDNRRDQFDLWQRRSPQGQDVLILLFSFDGESPAKFPCRLREDRGSYTAEVNGREVYHVNFLLCRGYGLSNLETE